MATVDIRLPNINADTEAGQIVQVKSYLYQFAEQMRWALNNIQQGDSGNANIQTVDANGNLVSTGSSDGSVANFGQIKSLIIKSADIVESFYEQIEQRLNASYVAQSDFGTYKAATSALITANSDGITQNYNRYTTLNSSVAGIQNQINNTNAYIKTGLLDTDESDNPIYGLEIGQTTSKDGTETFSKFARFTSNRLSFYDNGSTEVAYISDYKLYITNAQVTDTLILGGYKLEFNGNSGLYFKWIGR